MFQPKRVVVEKRLGVAAGLAVAVFSVVAFSGPLAAQSVKPGLWEMTIASRMTGAGIPQGMGARTMKMNLCIKPEDAEGSWEKLLKTMQDEDCTVSNLKVTGQSYSYDTACKSGMKGQMAGKITPEAMEQTGDMVIVEGGSAMKMNFNNKSRWLANVCPPGTLGSR